ncbi:NADH:ubiquinone reductase (Na(+)-transporting) subunit F [Pseudohalocynthiibacter aestuariivivens]|jgi:Na+-transporting NADH:ubiquinone oxidoreductase subunit F|uniref:Na(+)-translocating NADH-quinone reductase subunit F n=1 Tax=Pseudohalocynthiibacter aestuariivivens TaxID=1591409 RepID=A0ABV5JIN3_9RHOB|nr:MULTISPECIES: NADH:ubiquinone reductase (Na(+)-transporting) subunit F [Pseudohalocynthiibacter]MBS9716551.1 NADH:ubiquinone reductase (Na(+)-transporting) subunit F [Pseudohalocynthiibacter aestuariivivens]MCK0101621.1 NADH:ubiquinone reductase (Na(+)-transporting) subunit F [Pseudohalocynthiibacter sp. F2068]
MNSILAGIALFTLIVMVLVLSILTVKAMLSRKVAVTVTVNEDKKFTAQTGQKLLEVLNDASVLVPSACAGAGTCGLCRVAVPVGGGQVLPTERAKLGRAEMRNHVRLACQVVVREDMEVRVPNDLLGTESWECSVASVRMMTPFIREIVLDLPSGATPNLRAGSFVQVTAPPYDIRFADFDISETFEEIWSGSALRGLVSRNKTAVSRAYSIANRPGDKGKIVLNVRLALPPPSVENAPPGVVSSYLFNLRKGESLKVAGPYGSFGARDTGREMIFIGGGVGMAPLRAILFDQLERVGTSRKISFWYGARSRIELFYENELNELQEKHNNFKWTAALSDAKPSDEWDGPIGFIHDVAYERYLKDHEAPEECEYYLCGPPLMIRAVMSMLGEIGVEPDSIFNDDFGG